MILIVNFYRNESSERGSYLEKKQRRSRIRKARKQRKKEKKRIERIEKDRKKRKKEKKRIERTERTGKTKRGNYRIKGKKKGKEERRRGCSTEALLFPLHGDVVARGDVRFVEHKGGDVQFAEIEVGGVVRFEFVARENEI